MTDVASLISDLISAGVSPELVGRVAEAISAAGKGKEQATERSSAAERQARYREKKRNALRNCDVTRDVTRYVTDPSTSLSPSPPRDIINPPNPSPIPSPASSLRSEADARERASFARFWQAWPHKVGKPAAERAFGKVAGEIESILAGVERYVRDKPAERPWLNPATFLNQRRWEDAPAPEARAGPSYRDNRNGWAALAQEIYGKVDGSIFETGRNHADVLLLPVNGDSRQRASGDDAGELFGRSSKRFGL